MTQPLREPSEHEPADEVDVLIIGAGFSGLYQLHHLRRAGFKVKVYEAAPSLGGVWYWNCYPGARCDTMGSLYQFSAEELWQDWNFDELYPSWDQIRSYFEHVDRKLDLRKDIRFDTRVASARFDSSTNMWTVRAENGRVAKARILLLCTGIGSKPFYPAIDGVEDFRGQMYHTAAWPQEGVDLTGKRVGVIGTGASGVQVIQEAGPVAAELIVFQRTPNFALPMRQKRLDAEANRKMKERYPADFAKRARTFAGYDYDAMDFAGETTDGFTREQIIELYEDFWEKGGFWLWLGNFRSMYMDEQVNLVVYEFWRDKVRQRIKDPVLAEKLAPTVQPHPFGTKRISLEQNYFEQFNRKNVRLVDLQETPIERVTGRGVRTRDGIEYELDILVLATGFDMVTGGITAIDIRGTSGESIRDKWRSGVSAYLGSATNGFPNMLFVYGPLAPAGLSNGPSSSELHGDEIIELLRYMRDRKLTRIEATAEADDAWRERIDSFANTTLFGRSNSWYMAANVPGKAKQMINYPLGIPDYLEQWRQVKKDGYSGFSMS